MFDHIVTVEPDKIEILKAVAYLYTRSKGIILYYIGFHDQNDNVCRLSEYYKTKSAAESAMINREFNNKVLERTYRNGLTLYFPID